MKELITVEKAVYLNLQGLKVKVDEQQSTIIALNKKYRDLEQRYYTLLTNSPEQARKLVELGDYVEVVRD